MAHKLQPIKQSSGILIPATPETSDILQSKIKPGAVLVAEFRQVTNPAFHQVRSVATKLEALSKYFSPKSMMPRENTTVRDIQQVLEQWGARVSIVPVNSHC